MRKFRQTDGTGGASFEHDDLLGEKNAAGSLRRLNDGNTDSLIAALVKPIAVFVCGIQRMRPKRRCHPWTQYLEDGSFGRGPATGQLPMTMPNCTL